jgi:hypothetical protein
LKTKETALNERELKVNEAIKAVKRAHLDRYGMDDCDEAYISRLSEAELDLIIAHNKPVDFIV